jgi:hypothetical protein
MSKRPIKKTPIQELDARLQALLSKRIQAYRSGASYQIMEQLDRMISETQLDLYTESELERNRTKKDDDGEQWIV